MRRRQPNFYATGKAILSEGMVVHDWWKKDYNIHELARFFGVGALQRGVDAAKANGETVPQEALDALKSVSKG